MSHLEFVEKPETAEPDPFEHWNCAQDCQEMNDQIYAMVMGWA